MSMINFPFKLNMNSFKFNSSADNCCIETIKMPKRVFILFKRSVIANKISVEILFIALYSLCQKLLSEILGYNFQLSAADETLRPPPA